jgi:hypothetical protein
MPAARSMRDRSVLKSNELRTREEQSEAKIDVSAQSVVSTKRDGRRSSVLDLWNFVPRLEFARIAPPKTSAAIVRASVSFQSLNCDQRKLRNPGPIFVQVRLGEIEDSRRTDRVRQQTPPTQTWVVQRTGSRPSDLQLSPNYRPENRDDRSQSSNTSRV